MNESVRVFVSGTCAVFLGMTFLYFSIKLTGMFVSVVESRKQAREAAAADTPKGEK